MNNKERGKIEGLNEKLYSRTRYRDPADKRSQVKEVESSSGEQEVGGGWKTLELDEMLKHERTPEEINPWMKRIFIFALLFFIAAVAVSTFVFFGGTNFVSSKNVDITVLGPTIASAGEVLEFGVSVSNKNNANLELANLSIQYPTGSRNPENTSESLTYTTEELGVITAGSEAVHNVRVAILGATGDVKEIKFSVEYKVTGSNALFYKDKIFIVTIGEAPVELSVESPSSVTSGDIFTTTVLVSLNAQDVLRNVVLKAEYPHGYSVSDAEPTAVADGNVWTLGDLSPGDEKTVSIRGRLVGENEEERTFRFYVGVSDSNGAPDNLRIPIISLLNTVEIARPSLDLDVVFNGENLTTYVAPSARTISTVIRFQNNLPDKLINPLLEVQFSGEALDRFSVTPGQNGFFDSGDSTVAWNPSNFFGARELAPGEMGQVNLSFASLPSESLPSGARDINLTFSLSGVPIGSPGGQRVTVSENRTVRISSQVSLSSEVLRSSGPFTNHGPIPPKAEEETTYTVFFNVGNTQGDMSEAKVTARLGSGVSWLGPASDSSENVTYDPDSNLLTWDIGALSSGAGFSSSARELVFQISLTPSISQIGTVPTLVSNILFSGREVATGLATTVNNPSLSTRLFNDPTFIQGDDVVTQ